MRSPTHFQSRSTKSVSASRKSRILQVIAGAGLFLLGLCCSFYLTFPDELLRQRLVSEFEARLPIQVELEKAALQPLLTLTGEQMDIRLSDRSEVLYQIDSFLLDPGWSSLFTGYPGVDGRLNASSGELSFSWQHSGPLAMTAVDLPFDIPLATSPAMSLSGTISTGAVTSTVPLQSATESEVDINLAQTSVKGLEALTASAAGLRLGELSLQMTGQGTSFNITRLETSGGDLLVSGEGSLMLIAGDPSKSRINLKLSIAAGSEADPTLVGLLELAGTRQPDGSRQLRLTGTLANPIIR